MWPCFMLEPTGRGAAWLRRYQQLHPASGPPCDVCEGGYHQAYRRIEDVNYRFDEATRHFDDDGVRPPRSDPRWPTRAPCGHRFRARDQWQLFTLALYRDPDGSEVVIHPSPPPDVETAPPGAMWWAPWYPEAEWGPQGKGGLCVQLPGNSPWNVYGFSTGEPRAKWTVSGEPPNLTASPSINTGGYHGFLRDGTLTDSI